jgi:RNA polymerase sigma-70 factor (ECF subfamily)
LAIELRIVRELPYPEVAAELGVSEQTARARVSRGLRALRQAMPFGLEAEGGAG